MFILQVRVRNRDPMSFNPYQMWRAKGRGEAKGVGVLCMHINKIKWKHFILFSYKWKNWKKMCIWSPSKYMFTLIWSSQYEVNNFPLKEKKNTETNAICSVLFPDNSLFHICLQFQHHHKIDFSVEVSRWTFLFVVVFCLFLFSFGLFYWHSQEKNRNLKKLFYRVIWSTI